MTSVGIFVGQPGGEATTTGGFLSVVRLTSFAATDLLSFSRLDLEVPDGLSVIVGPNGSGKTNLGRIVRLAIAAVRAAAESDFSALEQAWALAGRYGSAQFEMRLGLKFEEASELSLIEDWARAALLTAFEFSDTTEVARHEGLLPESVRSDSVLANGELIVSRDDRRRQPWTVCWQSDSSNAHLKLGRENTLIPGPLAEEGTREYRRTSLQNLVLVPGEFPNNRSPEDQKAWEAQYESNLSSFTLTDVVDAGSPVQLTARRSNLEPEPLAFHRLTIRFPKLHQASGYLTFADIIAGLLSAALAVTDNRRVPVTTVVQPDHLNGPASLEDGSGLAIELLRLKNGDAAARTRFRNTQDVFEDLTGRHLDVRQQSTGAEMHIMPVLVDVEPTTGSEVDLPLHLTGAGIEESAWLATLLTGDHHTLVLDEPASNVSAVAQRRLLEIIRERRSGRQTIMITHSADLVPVQNASELSVITRLSRRDGRTKAHRPRVDPHEFDALKELLRHSQLRSLLFAAGVVLVEGPTEVDAFETWLARVDEFGLPTPESSHVVFLSVGGEERFAKHARLMEILGVPYAIVADGPAFVPGKALSKLPLPTPDTAGNGFSATICKWAQLRVRTLATEFGVNDRQGHGEIEAFFETVDAGLWAELNHGAGRRDKPLLGYRFASHTPVPVQIIELWRNLCTDLGLNIQTRNHRGGQMTNHHHG